MRYVDGALTRRFFLSVFVTTCSLSPSLYAQGRGGSDWTTRGGDAHRSSWVRTDPKISPQSMAKPGFQILWKIKLKNEPRQSNSLSAPVLMDRYIGYRGFRSYAFIGGSGDNVFTIDSDLGRIEWQKHFSATPAQGSSTCPGGMTAAVARPATSAFPTANAGGRGGGGGRGGPAKSGVGQPFDGAVTLSAVTTPPQPAFPPAAVQPGAAPGRGPARMPELLRALSSDGLLHAMYISNGDEPAPPVRLLPPNANVTALSVVDGVTYAITSGNCAGVPDGIWSLDPQTKAVASWKGPVTGDLAFGPSALYVTSKNQLIALEPKTLTAKAPYDAGAEFSTTPLVTQLGTRTLVVAATKNGVIHVIDGDSPGTALAKSIPGDPNPDALSSWRDSAGTDQIIVTGPQSITAWKLADRNGALSLEKSWTTNDVRTSAAPLIVNGVLFALARGDRNAHATLYAFEAATGKQLWTSGNAISGFVPETGGLAAGGSTVYFGSYDGTLWAFGFPIPH